MFYFSVNFHDHPFQTNVNYFILKKRMSAIIFYQIILNSYKLLIVINLTHRDHCLELIFSIFIMIYLDYYYYSIHLHTLLDSNNINSLMQAKVRVFMNYFLIICCVTVNSINFFWFKHSDWTLHLLHYADVLHLSVIIQIYLTNIQIHHSTQTPSRFTHFLDSLTLIHRLHNLPHNNFNYYFNLISFLH